MAKPAGATQSPKPRPTKLTRAERRVARAAKRESRRDTMRNVRQAFTVTRENDPRFIPYLVLAAVFAAAAGYLVVFAITSSVYLPIPVAVLAAFIGALFLFSRRAQKAMFLQAEGQPGAAGWLLQQQLRGDWRLAQAVAGTAQLDAVHRMVGRPGIVLVGEGAPHRVRGLIAQEKKKVARVSGDTPIYDVLVGTGEGELRLAKLSRYLVKLPANLSKEQVSALDKRLAALGGVRPPLPQGPMPAGAKQRNLQRTVRRRS
jgi:hypothetical protein